MSATTAAVEVPPYFEGPVHVRIKSACFTSREALLSAFLKEIAKNVSRKAADHDKDHWRLPVEIFEGEESKGAFVLSVGHQAFAEMLAAKKSTKVVRSSDDYFWINLQKKGLEDSSPRTGLFTVDFRTGEAVFRTDKDYIPVRAMSYEQFINEW